MFNNSKLELGASSDFPPYTIKVQGDYLSRNLSIPNNPYES